MIESPDLTQLAAIFIADSTGAVWCLVPTLTNGQQVCRNGLVLTDTANATRLLYSSKTVYYEDTHGNWNAYLNSGAWVTSAAPTRETPAVSTSRPYLIGYYGSGPAHTEIGYYPNATTNNSYMSPDFGAAGGGGDQPSLNQGYPTVIACQTFNIGNPTPCNSAAGAANGSFNNYYHNGIRSNILPVENFIYAARINHEWCLSQWSWSPYAGNGIMPAMWIAGFRNMVNAFRLIVPSIKIAWDFPLASPHSTAANDYYPGDAYVDIISSDVYFYAPWQGNGSNTGWNYYNGGKNSLTAWSDFAAAHGKPMAVWEWADGYNDGYCVTQFAQWIKQHNVVGHFYWDIGPDFAFSVCQNSLSAYRAAFPSTLGAYSGSLPFIPLPATMPSWA